MCIKTKTIKSLIEIVEDSKKPLSVIVYNRGKYELQILSIGYNTERSECKLILWQDSDDQDSIFIKLNFKEIDAPSLYNTLKKELNMPVINSDIVSNPFDNRNYDIIKNCNSASVFNIICDKENIYYKEFSHNKNYKDLISEIELELKYNPKRKLYIVYHDFFK